MTRARFYLLGFGALALIDTWTQIAFKLSARETGPFVPAIAFALGALRSPWMYAAAAGYVASFFAWMTVLEHAPIGAAFAVSHVEIVLILLVSVFLFGERLDASKLTGAALIMAGIALISLAPGDAQSAATEAHD